MPSNARKATKKATTFARATRVVLPYARKGGIDAASSPVLQPALDPTLALNAVSLLHIWNLRVSLCKDDGSCFIYAVLAHVCEDGSRPMYTPPIVIGETPRGKTVWTYGIRNGQVPNPSIQELRHQLHVRDLLWRRDPALLRHALNPPIYVDDENDDTARPASEKRRFLAQLGSYGGTNEWLIMAREFGVHIVRWCCNDPEAMANPKFRFVWIDRYWAHENKIMLLTAAEIRARAEETPSVRIAHVTTSNRCVEHFDTLTVRHA